MVFRTCIGFLHDKEDADDLTQEIFIQIYQSLAGFKGDAAVSTWIYRIAVNAALNKVRKAKKSHLLQRLEGIFGKGKGHEPTVSELSYESPENELIRAERREWIDKALNNLPEKQRIAIVLSKYDELSQREIAAIMELTEGAVEALIQRAKANLRKVLSAHR